MSQQKGKNMRLSIDNYQSILDKKQISHEYVQKATGLSKKTYLWILDNGFIEYETLERIADAIGCMVGDILKADPLPKDEKHTENVIEWIKDDRRATLSLSQRRTISRVRQLAAQYPDQCRIVAENKDGSIYAHIPVSWVRINPKIELTEEQREKRVETMKRNRAKRKL